MYPFQDDALAFHTPGAVLYQCYAYRVGTPKSGHTPYGTTIVIMAENQDNRNSWEELARNPNPLPLEDLWSRHVLSEEQLAVLRKYKKYLERLIQRHGFGWASLAELLLKFDSDNVEGNKQSFLKKLFGKHLEFKVTPTAQGFRFGTRSEQFVGVFFELRLI